LKIWKKDFVAFRAVAAAIEALVKHYGGDDEHQRQSRYTVIHLDGMRNT
jgi:hypothetical protein